ncbi:hypothetical protein ACHAWO_008717 [Cyclotella atomus]|uniref:Cytidyltransferase-like domain-containing protein n=1 Tax=Cyclotella atomus TaxID=382360 RepID=A0ABD3NJL9_9STRA
MMGTQIRKRVCLFGTSADPPTGKGGHLGIVTHLASMHDFDEVRVLPVYRHMFSNKRGKQAPFASRIEMCKLLFENQSKVIISEAERECFEMAAEGVDNSEKASIRVGTADLLSMLTTNEPNADFTLALGADTFIDLASGKWRRTDEIFQLIGHRIIVFGRKSEEAKEKEELIRQSIAKRQRWNETKSSIQFVAIPSLTDVSSSTVRSTTDEAILRNLITPPILEYMKQNKLYAFAESVD